MLKDNKFYLYLAFFLLLFLPGCSHGCFTARYFWQASTGQLALYNHERPLAEVIKDPRTKSETREKLKWVPEIKKMVEDRLGIKATGNYTTYVDLKRPYVIWSVSVAEKNELKLVHFSFPIVEFLVGSFPYLGFFKEDMAREWMTEKANEGYDVSIRGVSAYSTLGYFRDPLLSSMLTRQKGDLVNLIFHETAHGQIYLKSHGAFNEQLASFVGDYGERDWILRSFGENSEQYREWKDSRHERRVFGEILRTSADELKKTFSAIQKPASE